MLNLKDPIILRKVEDFQIESNKIERVLGCTTEEYEGLLFFIQLKEITLGAVTRYIQKCEPTAYLRSEKSMPGVRVGNHVAPKSGPHIVTSLTTLVDMVNRGALSAYEAHCQFLNLHPFNDGNGRGARAIWLWQMQDASLGFLHRFYYQALEANDARISKLIEG